MQNIADQSTNDDESPVLTNAEAHMICVLSQEFRSLKKLCRVLGIGCTSTLDRLVWRSRRTHPRTVARVRVALRREAERRLVVTFEGVQ